MNRWSLPARRLMQLTEVTLLFRVHHANRYTSGMDSVRFGRALGFGARSAARALAGAVDAATAPNPSASRAPVPPATARPTPTTTAPARPAGPIATAARSAARATTQVRATRKGIARGGKRFGEAIWGPFVKLSGVLWLEMTGAFFGIFALFAGQAVWSHRSDLRATPLNHEAHIHTFVFLAMALVFGYFAISSFIRARRRERSR
jgi:hypothetical protein